MPRSPQKKDSFAKRVCNAWGIKSLSEVGGLSLQPPGGWTEDFYSSLWKLCTDGVSVKDAGKAMTATVNRRVESSSKKNPPDYLTQDDIAKVIRQFTQESKKTASAKKKAAAATESNMDNIISTPTKKTGKTSTVANTPKTGQSPGRGGRPRGASQKNSPVKTKQSPAKGPSSKQARGREPSVAVQVIESDPEEEESSEEDEKSSASSAASSPEDDSENECENDSPDTSTNEASLRGRPRSKETSPKKASQALVARVVNNNNDNNKRPAPDDFVCQAAADSKRRRPLSPNTAKSEYEDFHSPAITIAKRKVNHWQGIVNIMQDAMEKNEAQNILVSVQRQRANYEQLRLMVSHLLEGVPAPFLKGQAMTEEEERFEAVEASMSKHEKRMFCKSLTEPEQSIWVWMTSFSEHVQLRIDVLRLTTLEDVQRWCMHQFSHAKDQLEYWQIKYEKLAKEDERLEAALR